MPHAAALVARIACIALMGVFVAAFGVGCDADPDRRLTKREYIQQSNDLQRSASEILGSLAGERAGKPATAEAQLVPFDELIDGYAALNPPRAWQDEHDTMVESLRVMRQAMGIVSRASPRNTAVINTQLARFTTAQDAFEQAVQDVNASR